MTYKVIEVSEESNLEEALNYWASLGWRLHTVETEYTTYVVIFERD